MRQISRLKRAELQRDAHAIRQRGQLAGRGVQQIASDIQHELDELRPLEAWRLAYGWTRPQVIAAIAALYEKGVALLEGCANGCVLGLIG